MTIGAPEVAAIVLGFAGLSAGLAAASTGPAGEVAAGGIGPRARAALILTLLLAATLGLPIYLRALEVTSGRLNAPEFCRAWAVALTDPLAARVSPSVAKAADLLRFGTLVWIGTLAWLMGGVGLLLVRSPGVADSAMDAVVGTVPIIS